MEHSAALTPAEKIVCERIDATRPLTFAEFMSLALYDPAVGYYARRPMPLGARGDYYTGPELHPGCAALIGRQLEQLWEALARPSPFVVHEAGPGSGIFTRDFLNLAKSTRPELYAALEYRLDEKSSALRQAQERLLMQAGHRQAVSWVDGFELGATADCILANELLDAFPVHLVQIRGGQLEELFVALDRDRLVLQPGQPSTTVLEDYFAHLGLWPAEGCRAEMNLAALDWIRSAASGLGRGLLLVLDYGYPAERLFHPSRRRGSLLCYYRHTLNSEPLARIGEQDITSHVDFTSLRWAGVSAGLETLGLVSQQRLLKNLGWSDLRRAVESAPVGQAELQANLRALDALVEPSGLGRILALFQHRGLEGFAPLGLVGRREDEKTRIRSSSTRTNVPLRTPEHVRLPDAAEAEGMLDFEAQWAEFWSSGEAG